MAALHFQTLIKTALPSNVNLKKENDQLYSVPVKINPYRALTFIYKQHCYPPGYLIYLATADSLRLSLVRLQLSQKTVNPLCDPCASVAKIFIGPANEFGEDPIIEVEQGRANVRLE